jgi:hypothetical protein
MRRADWYFVITMDGIGNVVGFSKVIWINKKPCPIFHINQDPFCADQTKQWSAEIVDPRLGREQVWGIHLRAVAWKCGYSEEETGKITELARIFDLHRPSRKTIAGILGIPESQVRLSTATRRE